MRRSLAVLGSLAVALALAACSQKAADSVAVVGLSGEPGTLDPAFAYDFTANPVVNEITEGLLRFGPKGELLPNLAESVQTPDAVTYLYKIRQGVKFQDGSALTAEDVAFSLNRTRDPKTASPLAWMFGSVKDISVADASTVKVALKAPDAQWRYTVATTAGHIISKAYFQAHEKDFGKAASGVLGTGPFKFVSWKSGTEIELARNADYWDKAAGGDIAKAVFKFIPDGATRAAGLKTGELTAAVNLAVDSIPVIRSFANVALQENEGFGDDWIALNTAKKPFSDANARKALASAFNAKALLDAVVKDAGVPADGLPVGAALYSYGKDKWEALQKKAPFYPYSVEAAKKFLAASASPKGFKAKLVTDGDSTRIAAAQALQADAKAVGIDIEIEKVTDAELTTRQFSAKRDYDIILGGWGSDFPDPAANVTPFLASSGIGEGGSDFAAYKNAKVDALLDQQATLGDDAKRAELLVSALEISGADAPYIFYDHPKVFFASSKKFSGYVLSPIWYWDSLLRSAKLGK